MLDERTTSRILAQARPSGTSAVQAYAPGTNRIAHVDKVVITNTTGSAVGGYVFVDADGTTWTEATAVLWNEAIAANHSISIEFANALQLEAGGSIGIRTSTGSALTFTVIGRQTDVR